MRRIFRFFLPPLILLGSIAFAAGLIANSPETERQRPREAKPAVEIFTVRPQKYRTIISSQGTISPQIETTLTSEVSGRVVKVADTFSPGGFFEAGELLLQIDPRDYQNAVTIAQSELALRQVELAEEQAPSRQALTDWKKMPFTGDPDPLLLRTPQLKHAEAALDAAAARLRQAELNLERTCVTAPYAGRVLHKNVDRGQYLPPGKELARIYASDAVEVRLPLTDEQLRYLKLPEEFRHEKSPHQDQTPVSFSLKRGNQTFDWQGHLIRTEGAVDVSSRQLFVVAQIKNPYLRKPGRPQLKIGQFVNARIQGAELTDVYVIPRSALHDKQTVHIIEKDNRLSRRKLEVLWQDETDVIVSGPLQPGERISLTRLSFAADGIEVQVAEQKPKRQNADKKQGGKN